MGSMRQRRQIADRMDSIVRKIRWIVLSTIRIGGNSRYFVVKAFGDLDEDDRDTKISCTKMELKKELDFSMLLLRGAAYMAIHPDRPWCSLVCKETGVGNNGFVIVRGKQPKAKGRKNDLLILVQEEPDSNEIIYVNQLCVDGTRYKENQWHGIAD